MTSISELDSPPSPNGKEVLTPPTRAAWRTWLSTNHSRREGLWIVYRKKLSDLDGPIYDDLVEEALCFGWIDSTMRRVDEARVVQWFSPRRKGGLWSALNKERIRMLEEIGSMAPPGRAVIDQAIADGSWSQADDVDALVVPADLAAALDAAPGARDGWDGMADSTKRQHLWWIHSAKRDATRADRITSTVETARER